MKFWRRPQGCTLEYIHCTQLQVSQRHFPSRKACTLTVFTQIASSSPLSSLLPCLCNTLIFYVNICNAQYLTGLHSLLMYLHFLLSLSPTVKKGTVANIAFRGHVMSKQWFSDLFLSLVPQLNVFHVSISKDTVNELESLSSFKAPFLRLANGVQRLPK